MGFRIHQDKLVIFLAVTIIAGSFIPNVLALSDVDFVISAPTGAQTAGSVPFSFTIASNNATEGSITGSMQVHFFNASGQVGATVNIASQTYTFGAAPTAFAGNSPTPLTTATNYNFTVTFLETSPTNGDGKTAFSAFTVSPNTAPTATPQTVGTNEDTNATITLAGTDPESDPLSFTIESLPTAGALYQTSDGTTLGTQITTVPTAVSDASDRD